MKNVRIILFSSCKPGILPQSIRRPKVRQARLRKLPGNRPPTFFPGSVAAQRYEYFTFFHYIGVVMYNI